MKICVIFGGSKPENQRKNPVTREVIEILRSRDAEVEVIEPRLMNYELSEVEVSHDLYIIKSISNPMAAAYGAALHALGAATFNPFPIVQLVRNKMATTRLLAENGVPVPATYVVSDVQALVPMLAEGPLIVKPYNGSGGVGIKRVATRDELMSISDVPPIFAQRCHTPDDGLDRKISVIGGKVFGVKRVFPLREYSDKIGTPFEIDDEIREIAARISQALSIDMFSFDVMLSGGKPYVVDVGAFGGMMGVPDAPKLIAERIIRAWEERVC